MNDKGAALFIGVVCKYAKNKIFCQNIFCHFKIVDEWNHNRNRKTKPHYKGNELIRSTENELHCQNYENSHEVNLYPNS